MLDGIGGYMVKVNICSFHVKVQIFLLHFWWFQHFYVLQYFIAWTQTSFLWRYNIKKSWKTNMERKLMSALVPMIIGYCLLDLGQHFKSPLKPQSIEDVLLPLETEEALRVGSVMGFTWVIRPICRSLILGWTEVSMDFEVLSFISELWIW